MKRQKQYQYHQFSDYYRSIAFHNHKHQCEKCKTKDEKLEVHHKDENRNNNIPENLMLVCHTCHLKIHGITEKIKIYNLKYKRGTKGCHKKRK